MKPYYEHAGITIYHGDWREVAKRELYGCAECLCTDPPYGLKEAAGKNKSRGYLALAKDYGNESWDDAPPSAYEFLTLHEMARWRIIFGANHFGDMPASSCWLIWDKVNGDTDFADCEIAWTNLPRAVRRLSYMWNGMLKEKPEIRYHPTQKPLAVMKWCLSLVTGAQSVVDPYMGSGTTLVAAKSMNMSAIGYEISERYCEIAAKRLAQEILF